MKCVYVCICMFALTNPIFFHRIFPHVGIRAHQPCKFEWCFTASYLLILYNPHMNEEEQLLFFSCSRRVFGTIFTLIGLVLTFCFWHNPGFCFCFSFTFFSVSCIAFMYSFVTSCIYSLTLLVLLSRVYLEFVLLRRFVVTTSVLNKQHCKFLTNEHLDGMMIFCI